MSIEERILNDSSCSAYVDTNRKYVEIAFKDGAYWGYEQGCKDMIDKAYEWIKANMLNYINFEEGFMYEVDTVDNLRKAMEE